MRWMATARAGGGREDGNGGGDGRDETRRRDAVRLLVRRRWFIGLLRNDARYVDVRSLAVRFRGRVEGATERGNAGERFRRERVEVPAHPAEIF